MDDTLLSKLEYHGHAALIGHMASEPCRWDGRDLDSAPGLEYFTMPCREFDRRCQGYAAKVDENSDLLYGDERAGRNARKPFLYNPAHFVTFGPTDNLSLVAIDDLDIVVDITSRVSIPIKQATLAFCPSLDRLGVNQKNYRWLFEMSDLGHGKGDLGQSVMVPHPFLSGRNLIAVTYFRLSGLAAIGPGLLFLEATLRAMADRIQETLADLKAPPPILDDMAVPSFRCMFLDPQGWPDIATVMVGSNYTVMASVLVALNTLTLQNVYDAFPLRGPENTLREAVKQFGFHSKIARIESGYRRQFKEGNRDVTTSAVECDPFLGSNHVFCSTHTTVGMTLEAFLTGRDDSNSLYSGVVYADPAFNVTPGHLFDICQKKPKTTLLEKGMTLENPEEYYWLQMGLFDGTERSTYSPLQIKPVKLQDMVEQIKFLRGIEKETSFTRPLWPIQGLCSELSIPVPRTGLKPTPTGHVNIRPILADLRRSLFQESIAEAEGTWKDTHLDGRDESTASPKRKILPALKQAISELRIPAPLSSSIMYLFVNYAQCVSDPNLFDNVLDLHEAFMSVHRVITREMRLSLHRDLEELKQAGASDDVVELKRLSFLSAETIRELTAVVNMLESALHHRTRTTFSATESWHMPLDFKGEVNKLLNAADVPLKCGLSVLRRIIREEMNYEGNGDPIHFSISNKSAAILKGEEDAERRYRVGGASKFSYNSRAITRRFGLGERDINYIADVSLNIGHLVRPGVLYAHIHETGHMISHLLRHCQEKEGCLYPRGEYCQRRCDKSSCYRLIPQEDPPEVNKEVLASRERFSEIFAEMAGCGMVFADLVDHDPEKPEREKEGTFTTNEAFPGFDAQLSYFKHYFGIFSLDPISMSGSSREVLLKLAEAASRAFLASDPFVHPPRTDGTKKPLYSIDDEYRLRPTDVDQARERFIRVVEDTGPLYYWFPRLWAVPESRAYILRHFEEAYWSSYRVVCCMWDNMNKTLRGIYFDRQAKGGGMGTNPAPGDHWSIVKQIREGYYSGRPPIRLLYRESRDDDYRKNDPERHTHLDSLFLVCHLLRVHLHEVFGRIEANKQCVLVRTGSGGESRGFWSSPESSTGMNPQIIDKFFSGVFSADYDKREEYFRHRVAVIKSLWDLSTNIRGRTMRRLLDLAYPEMMDEKSHQVPIVTNGR